MQRLEISGAVRPIYGSLGVKQLMFPHLCLVCDSFAYCVLYDCMAYHLFQYFSVNV